MQALNAFTNAASGAADLIPSGLVPNLALLHPGTKAYSQGAAVLYDWLKQQGLSQNQIMEKTPAEWSDIKIKQLDKGFNISGLVNSDRVAMVDKIPKTSDEWREATYKYLSREQESIQIVRKAWTLRHKTRYKRLE